MIKRTKSMATKVSNALLGIKSEFLLCRTRRRHDYKRPDMQVPVRAGKHSAVINFVCQECGTVRKDTWLVRISKELHLSIPEDGFVSRVYNHPDGYRLDGELDITPTEFQQEFMNRMFQNMLEKG